MDSSGMFRPGFVPGGLRPSTQPHPLAHLQQHHPHSQPQYFQQPHRGQQPPAPIHPQSRDGEHDAPNRVAHTLTACCRCRQRKTRCDPTLPRCLPCERSGSVCEYFDSTKGRKISRFYVVKLQEKVRQLESELAQFTDEDLPEDNEDMIRPGGFVRLSDTDETPRYLGPSSGIAMTRLLMEEAKRYTESQRISELIPELNARRMERLTRMQSIAGINGRAGSSFSISSLRKKSYPMISAHPAQNLPSRPIVDKLVEVFISRAQVFTPTLHEGVFTTHLKEVFDGDSDPYKNFVVRMVMAISLQKLDTQYAGLADSYYLAAMEMFEDVVRPKDLRTLQCLTLIGQYSLLTPTRNNVYHIVGLATRICQQLAIADEKTIETGSQVDPLALDMRRRLSWIVTTMELGLAHTMGRPNGLSKVNDAIDVNFFANVDDEYITENGILSGPESEKKAVAIHFCKMRLCQAEIRRVLYEKKRPTPSCENDEWFGKIEEKIQNWLDTAPKQPAWCRPWFSGRYHAMLVSVYRPSPQVPKPSARAALRCYESSAHVTALGSQQVKKGAIDITWVFLLTIYMSLNTILWSVSYPEVRKEHSREEVEELINTSLDIVDQCCERWPGASAASQLYSIFAKACLQSYDANSDQQSGPVFSETQYGDPNTNYQTPPSQVDPNSPSASDAPPMGSSGKQQMQQQQYQQQALQQAPVFNTPQFGFGFAPPNSSTQQAQPPFAFDDGPGHPQFRSGSIFLNPPSTEPMGRRFSYFPPDAPPQMNSGENSIKEEDTPPASYPSNNLAPSPSLITSPDAYISPPSSNQYNTMSPATTITSASSPTPTPTVRHVSPMPIGVALGQTASLPSPIKFESPVSTPHMQSAQSTYGGGGHSAQSSQRQSPPQPISAPLSSQQLQQAYGMQQRRGQPRGQSSQQPAPEQQSLPPPMPTQVVTAPSTATTNAPSTTGPSAVGDWFSPPPPFISPYAFSNMNGAGTGYLSDPTAAFSGYGLGGFGGVNHPLNPLHSILGGLQGNTGSFTGFGAPTSVGASGYSNPGGFGGPGMPPTTDGIQLGEGFGYGAGMPLNPQRHGSLSQEQQMELMDVLETEGMGDIDTFLNMGIGLGGSAGGAGQGDPSQGGLNWQ
ncbi:fungal specific transcription factor domain-containing protein [Ophiostoma piceae UAMH 11346]|uniref:Fungal specific transcription factor domain-containing protein n=1 Tax=Ophiostoma piceae (strain UAMH 11346) TaxID=1262450 RepID=S3DAK2_OPHP1|nr:fungal specific transcription factor domain-containing protein [Ophiostoma piceae UAMH 11346]